MIDDWLNDLTKQIPLTNGGFALVDASDYDWLMESKWFRSEKGYALRRREGRQSGEGMHRVLLSPAKGMVPDHINGDRLDNRRCNLRVVTSLQNAQNRGKNKNSVSQYKGVSWKVANNKWQARIRVEGKQHHIGLYDTELEAAQAYNEAAKLQHGQYARFNNVPECNLRCGEISDADLQTKFDTAYRKLQDGFREYTTLVQNNFWKLTTREPGSVVPTPSVDQPVGLSHLQTMARVMQESFHHDKTFLDVDTASYFEKLLRIGFAAAPKREFSEQDRWDAMTAMLASLKPYATPREKLEAALTALLERFELRRKPSEEKI